MITTISARSEIRTRDFGSRDTSFASFGITVSFEFSNLNAYLLYVVNLEFYGRVLHASVLLCFMKTPSPQSYYCT